MQDESRRRRLPKLGKKYTGLIQTTGRVLRSASLLFLVALVCTTRPRVPSKACRDMSCRGWMDGFTTDYFKVSTSAAVPPSCVRV